MLGLVRVKQLNNILFQKRNELMCVDNYTN